MHTRAPPAAGSRDSAAWAQCRGRPWQPTRSKKKSPPPVGFAGIRSHLPWKAAAPEREAWQPETKQRIRQGNPRARGNERTSTTEPSAPATPGGAFHLSLPVAAPRSFAPTTSARGRWPSSWSASSWSASSWSASSGVGRLGWRGRARIGSGAQARAPLAPPHVDRARRGAARATLLAGASVRRDSSLSFRRRARATRAQASEARIRARASGRTLPIRQPHDLCPHERCVRAAHSDGVRSGAAHRSHGRGGRLGRSARSTAPGDGAGYR